jgi:hypothetical protein
MLTGIFVFLFVISSVAGLIAININPRIFKPEIYQSALEQNGAYKDMAYTILNTATESKTHKLLFKNFPPEITKSLINKSYPTESFKKFINDAIAQTLDALLKKRKPETIILSSEPLQKEIASPGFETTFRELLGQRPECTDKERGALIVSGIFVTEDTLLLCNAPGSFTNVNGTLDYKFSSFIPDQLKILAANILENITLVDLRFITPAMMEQLERARNAAQFALAPCIVFLLLITIFSVRSLNDWLTWWGWSFFISGALSYFIAIIAPSQINARLNTYIYNSPQTIPPIWLELGKSVFNIVLSSIVEGVKNHGTLLGCIGLAMLIIVWVKIFAERKK